MKKILVITFYVFLLLLTGCNKKDTSSPVITVGNTEITISVGDDFTVPPCSVSDNVDTDLSCVIGGDTVDVNTPGTYTITFDATDEAENNATQVSLVVSVVDLDIPVITVDNTEITLGIGGNFTAPPCSVSDNVDLDLSCVIGGDTVDVNTIGTYEITFDATDVAGNNANQVTLIVNIIDLVVPLITVDNTEVTMNIGDDFTLPTCAVSDNVDQDLSCVIGGDTVDVDTLGTYTITFDAVDSEGNNAIQVVLIVNVLDLEEPTITLSNSEITIGVGDDFRLPTCTVSDNVDTDLSCVIGRYTVDVDTLGTYTMTFDAVDSEGNNAEQVTLVVNVVDLEVPVITVDNTAITLGVGAIFTMPQCSVSDNFDTDLSCVIGGDTLDVNTPGLYIITFDAVDSSLNNADQVTLEVTVVSGNIYSGGFTFNIDEGEIIGYDGSLGLDLVIPSSIINIPVAKISSIAFANKYLMSLTIPESVTQIGEDAFCDNLFTYNEITIEGDSTRFDSEWRNIGFPLKYYNGFAFDKVTQTIYDYDISYGTDVVIPAVIDGVAVDTIGSWSFYNMSITSLVISEGITEIEDRAFYYNQISTITLPTSMTTIGEHAFYYNQISTITIPASMITIGESAFSHNNLISINILGDSTRFYVDWISIGFPLELVPETEEYIEDNGFILYINSNTIVEYTGTESVIVIPSVINGVSVNKIGDNAFSYKHITSLTIPNSVVEIGEKAFYGNYISDLTIPASVTTIGNFAFNTWNEFNSITIEGDQDRFNDIWTTIGFPIKLSPNAIVYNGLVVDGTTGVIVDYDNSYGTDVAIPSIIEGITITRIGEMAFSYKGLTSVVLPNTIESIGIFAFEGNELLTITIPESVTEIEYEAFYGNQLTIDNVIILGDADRFDFRWYDIGFPIETYNGFVFDKLTGTIIDYDMSYGENVIIPSVIDGVAVTIIGEDAFYDKEIVSVVIPDSVIEIRAYAFESNYLESVIIPDSVTLIGESAFYDNSITDVTLSANVYVIGDYAFEENELESVVIPESVIVIGRSAFADNYLNDIVIPAGVIVIGEDAFYYNDYIESVTIEGDSDRFNDEWDKIGFPEFLHPDYITYQGMLFDTSTGAIIDYDGSLTLDIIIPEQIAGLDVTIIKSGTFDGLYLTSVVIPASVVEIEYQAFAGNNFDTVTINGDELRFSGNWNDLGFPDDLNPKYVYYLGFDFDVLEGEILHYDSNLGEDMVIPSYIDGVAVTAIADYAFYWGSIVSVTIPDTVVTIGDNAFDANDIVSVTIEGDNNRFNDDWDRIGLPNVLNPKHVHYQGYTFDPDLGEIIAYDDSFGTNITIPAEINGVNVTAIAYRAFHDLELTHVVIPEGVLTIGEDAFTSNYIVSLTIPSTVTNIGSGAFAGNLLTNFSIPGNVVTIGDYAFAGNNLNTLILEEGLVTIGEGAFWISGLTNVHISSSVTTIGEDAFSYNSITAVTIAGVQDRFNSDWVFIGLPIELIPA